MSNSLNKLAGKTVVVKVGGELIDYMRTRNNIVQDLQLLSNEKIKVVIVHGGKPQIDKSLASDSTSVQRVEGLRVTDLATIEKIKDVYIEIANLLINELSQAKVNAISLLGFKDELLIGEPVQSKSQDLKLVGKVIKVNHSKINKEINNGNVVIISPLAYWPEKSDFKLNVNADHAAVAVAGAIKADYFLLLTNVDGVKDKSKKTLASISKDEFNKMKDETIILDGMIPKVESALMAVEGGVKTVKITNGMIDNPISSALTNESIGTKVV